MKTAFYRKYRPQRFADVIGQEAAVSALKNQVAGGRVGHAYIFTGIRGTGKTTLAKILAKAVNCLNPQGGEPCGVCDICTGIDAGAMLDVTEIDAASNNGVDNVRMLREETAYLPAVCRMRVYIIDEVHMLTREAFNALLKIMEEPPSHVLFILATTEIHKVPATILSRCQRYDLKRISAENIEAALLRVAALEGIALDARAAALIARLSDGALRDALSLLDTTASLGGAIDEGTVARLTGVADKSYLFDLCGALARKDLGAVFGRLAALYADSVDPTRLCLELTRHYRNLLLYKTAGAAPLADCAPEDIERYKKQAAELELPEILRALTALSDTADKMGAAPDRTLLLELCCIRLCGGTPPQAAGNEVPWQAVQPPAQPPQKAPMAGAQRETAPEPAQETRSEPDDAVPWQNPPASNKAEQNPPAAEEPHPARVPEGQKPAPLEPQPTGERESAPDGNSDPRLNPNLEETPVSTEKLPVQSGGLQPFEGWRDVIAALLPQERMLYSALCNSRAFLTPTQILVDGVDDFFFNQIRNNAVLREIIARVGGVRLPVASLAREGAGLEVETAAQDARQESIDDLIARANDLGLDVELKD